MPEACKASTKVVAVTHVMEVTNHRYVVTFVTQVTSR